MSHLPDFADARLASSLLKVMAPLVRQELNIMEVCGTHTMAAFRCGIRSMLPEGIRLISGPGCPVCVTPDSLVDLAIGACRLPGAVLVTFGDMLQVPGSLSSLEKERARNGRVKIVYSPRDALLMAREEPDLNFIFFAIGFETTAPNIASALLEAARSGIENFYLIVAHKLVPPAMRALVEHGEVKIHGFICPGHVSTIIGSQPYQVIPEKFGVPCVISGFEPLDMLQSIYMILKQRHEGKPRVEIQYRRAVRPEGNEIARWLMERCFEPVEADWRGLGLIPGSGLSLREEFKGRDALNAFELSTGPRKVRTGCRCGEILRGVIRPDQCHLFAQQCTPVRPLGPCMVTSEGTCAAYYRYGGEREERSWIT